MNRTLPRPLAVATLALGLLSAPLGLPEADPGSRVHEVLDGHIELSTPSSASPAPARSLLTASAAGDYAFLSGGDVPARWDPCDPIDYRVNLAAGPRDAAALVLTAVREVGRATGLVFRYQGTSSFVPRKGATTEPGLDLSLAFARPAASDLWNSADAPAGIAGMSWRYDSVDPQGRRTGRAVDGRVLLNADDFAQFDRWIDAGSHSSAYVRNVHLMAKQVVMHEVAHAVGLGHSSPTGGQVMAPVASGDGRVTGWGAGDLAGLALLGASQGCLAGTAEQAAAGVRPDAPAAPAVPAWQPLVAKAAYPSASTPRVTTPTAPTSPATAPTAAPAPAAAPAPVKAVRPTVTGPRTARRGTLPVLVVRGTPGAVYSLLARGPGTTRFSTVRRGRLAADGTARLAMRTNRDFRWYAVVGGVRTGAGLTQMR